MKLRQVLSGAAFAAGMLAAGAVSATVVTVDGTAGPWDPAVAGNASIPYGVGDQTAPATVAVNAGDNIVVTYLSGTTSAFGGVPPSVDAAGYVGGVFGSGADCNGSQCTGIGSSGQPIPSFYLDPTNTGPQIALNALIGAFVDATGKVLLEFAPGNGPFPITAPTGAVALQLGVNDDIFTTNHGALAENDNSGSLSIEVDGSTVVTAVPEPATWTMMLVALGGLGAAKSRSRRRVRATA